jgi:hypothetical protein
MRSLRRPITCWIAGCTSAGADFSAEFKAATEMQSK